MAERKSGKSPSLRSAEESGKSPSLWSAEESGKSPSLRSAEESKAAIASGLFWKVMENGGTQGVQFLVSVILARLVMPAEYASIALITIFITIANVLIQNSFNTALIQNKDVTSVDYSSVFYLNLMAAVILYLVLFNVAPAIADFYQIEQLAAMLRVLSVTLFFGAALSVQNAIVIRAMKFRSLCLASFWAAVISGGCGIAMAYRGFGVWAFVAQQLCQNLVLVLVLGGMIRWRPQPVFSMVRIRSLFSFGWKLLCSGLLDVAYTNIYGLVIGKVYNPAMLAYYNRGNQFPLLIANNIGSTIQAVMLPAYSGCQDHPDQVKAMVKKTVKMGCFLMFPMMGGMAAAADAIIHLLLTGKWLGAIPFLQLLCLSYAFWPVHVANLQAVNAMGRSDLFLKLELVKKGLGMISLILTIPYGVMTMVVVKVGMEFVCLLVNALPGRKLFRYGVREQLRDMIPAAAATAVMAVIVWSISWIGASRAVTLILQTGSGIAVYLISSWFLNRECMAEIVQLIKEAKERRKV